MNRQFFAHSEFLSYTEKFLGRCSTQVSIRTLSGLPFVASCTPWAAYDYEACQQSCTLNEYVTLIHHILEDNRQQLLASDPMQYFLFFQHLHKPKIV